VALAKESAKQQLQIELLVKRVNDTHSKKNEFGKELRKYKTDNVKLSTKLNDAEGELNDLHDELEKLDIQVGSSIKPDFSKFDD